MRRRELVGLLLMAAMPRAQAQQIGKLYRVAFVHPSYPGPWYQAFFAELHRLGYIEGQNLIVERYSGEGQTERYAELAREVVRLKPDLIFVVTTYLALHFKAATTTIPVVAITVDPVTFGLVTSLARRDSNITGVTIDGGVEIWGKRLQYLREAIPTISRVGLLAARSVWESGYVAAAREITQQAGLALLGPPLDGVIQEAEYRRIFAVMAEARVDALIVFEAPENWTYRQLIVELAEAGRLPAIYSYREHTELGGLMAYVANLADLCRRAANQVDQILRGSKPGEIPFEQATKFDLILNLKAAKALGIEISPSLLARADEVIE